MPARIIEELTSRKKEKIATFLTFESIVAVLLAFMPIFMLSGSWPLLVRVPVCAAAAVAGYVLTLELHGLPLYEHLLWTARGLYRLRVHGNHVGPDDLPGAIPAPNEDRVIVANGPIELVQRDDVLAGHALFALDTQDEVAPSPADDEVSPSHDDLARVAS
ncbi:MAG: hypothetical protein SFW09_07960 [Hyphomicrobiaceae bacterium]|jgi:hypothetical protein|nr:hypothetical protein [Hyphomicrobiaceae bacterium]